MKKKSFYLLVAGLLPLSAIASEYIIRVDTGDIIVNLEEISRSETAWSPIGELEDCKPSVFPLNKLSGDIYSHEYLCNQEQVRTVTSILKDEFSGKTQSSTSEESIITQVSQFKNVIVSSTEMGVSNPIDENCSDWSNSSNQNSDKTLLDQTRVCNVTSSYILHHEVADVSVYEQDLSESIEVENFQSIARDNSSCFTLLSEDSRLSTGQYQLASGVYHCDMSDGGWTLMFNQNVDDGYFTASNALSHRESSPSTNGLNYSSLGKLDLFRRDNKLTFKLQWPNLGIRNIWSQTTNPAIDQPVSGYKAISIQGSGFYWGGLERRCDIYCGSSYMEGSISHSNWFYAVASYNPWITPDYTIKGVPAFSSKPEKRVQLWVK